jgi:hypothetical protein
MECHGRTLTQEKVDSAVNRYPGKISYEQVQPQKWGKAPSVRTPDAGGKETIEEESLAAHSRVVKTRVDLRVKSIEKRTCDEVRWPN